MIICFKVKNFRSIKEQVELSMEASTSKSKSENVFEVETKPGKIFRLLKTAVIFGPNASGKSNIIRAYWTFRQIISLSFRNDVNDPIKIIEPFELSPETNGQPTEFSLHFIGPDKTQFIYSVSISQDQGVLEETLKFYPEKSPIIIYKRKGRNIVYAMPFFFVDLTYPKVVNPKRLLLSELGNSGDFFWENLRNYFVLNTMAFNSAAGGMVYRLATAAKRLFENDSEQANMIKKRVVRLVKLSDLGITDIDLKEEMVEEFRINTVEEPDETYGNSRKEKRFKTYHNVYKDNQIFDVKQFDLLRQGSTGTIAIVGLSAEILTSFEAPSGRTLWIDEMENSLHPHLCRFLIELYHHPKTNPHNAQLIFATHETTLLDKNMFRRDQIWITTKNKQGETKLVSIYDLDIEGLREDLPFDRWYMSGKFGGLPKIKSMDFIFEREQMQGNG
jgi:AAA15 family ATPase/GTPase